MVRPEDDADQNLPPAQPSIHDKDARTLPVSGTVQRSQGDADVRAGQHQSRRSVEDSVARRLDALVPPSAPRPDYKKLVGREGLITQLNVKIKNVQIKLLDQMSGQARQSNVERELTTVARETAETWAKAFRVRETEEIPPKVQEELDTLVNKLRLRWLVLKKTTELVQRGSEIVASTTSLIEDSSTTDEVRLSLPNYLDDELQSIYDRALTLVTKLKADQDRYQIGTIVRENESNDKQMLELSRAVIQMMVFAAFSHELNVEAPQSLIDTLMNARIVMLFLDVEDNIARHWGGQTQITPLLEQFLDIYTPAVALTSEPFYSLFWEKVLNNLRYTQQRLALYEKGQLSVEALGIGTFGLVDFLIAKNLYQKAGQETLPAESVDTLLAVVHSRYFDDIIKAIRLHKPKMFMYREKDRQDLIAFLTDLRSTR